MMRIAAVTGGSDGIGFATCRLLGEIGHSIIVLDNNGERLAHSVAEFQTSGMTCHGRLVDVSNPTDVETVSNELSESGLSPQILVNTVGGSTLRQPLIEMDPDTFESIVTLNLMTAFYCCRYFGGKMRETGWGRIVNVASIAGRTHALSTNSNGAYIAAKAGLIGMTKQLAAELGPSGVAVNAVAYGPVLTPRVERGWGNRSGEDRQAMERSIPARRFGTTSEAAAAIGYLCGEDTGFTMGAVLDVNGGLYM